MPFIRSLTPLLFVALALGLGFVVVSMPEHNHVLQRQVAEHLEASGVKNPVTAVLLNFRAYDTLLEMTVLLLAVQGVWAFGGRTLRASFTPGPVLETFTALLLPLLVLVGAYLLWVGAYGPGGAFQAGAVLGTVGILLALNDKQPLPVSLSLLWPRLALCIGLLVFTSVAAATLLAQSLLQYPTAYVGILILLIESAATVSIAFTLVLLFVGRVAAKGSSNHE